ncbi:hypothetical protein BDR06DRAFT_973116 [Suillus hirtellus]|nr:hypothetical protein BDR06DRAFT_973116 [Suillus hirtellus]
MASSSHHNPQIGTPALFDSFIFESIGLMPLYGDFVGVDNVDFMAYLALGHGPALYPLYASSSLEVTQSKEVPVYVSSVGSENSTTIVHLACHPTGYHPWGDIDFTTFTSMSDSIDHAIIPDEYIALDTVMSDDIGRAYHSNDATFMSTSDSVGHVIISNEYIASDTMMSGDVVRAYHSNDAVMTDTHYGDRYMTSKDLTSDNTSEVVMSNSPTIYSWISYSANMMDNGAPSTADALRPNPTRKRWKNQLNPKSRVGNPHLLNFEWKADAIHDTWPQALLLANIRADDLEEALCTIGHSHAGFGFDDVPDNGFAWFFGCQIAKEIMWHIIFCSSLTHGVQLVLADMEPATFRNVNHPLFPTMSLLGSSCYSAVLEKYLDLTNIPIDLLTQYPATEDVYDQLCKTAVELVGQSDDEDHPKLMTNLSNLCRIVIDDVYQLGRLSKKSKMKVDSPE